MKYKHLELSPLPRVIQEALKLLGTKEVSGDGNNPTILEWAKEVGGWEAGYYTKDSIPWCGLFAAVVAKRAGKEIPKNYLRALSWATFGEDVNKPALGDVLTFVRNGGGHVGFYIAEDDECYHVLGGNQSDSVSITRIKKSRLYEARRPKYNVRPWTVQVYKVDARGEVSENEA